VCFIFTNSFNFLVLKFKSLMINQYPFSIWFDYEYKLGTSHLDPSKSWDLLFSGEDILTTAESLITPLDVNEESTYEESCTFNEEQLGDRRSRRTTRSYNMI
jgi:hypothetical protein